MRNDRFGCFFRHWIALGLFLQLAGLCFVVDGSRYATIVNLSLFLPTLLSLPLFRSWTQWSLSSTLWLIALLCWVLGVALFNSGSEDGPVHWLRVTLFAWLYVSAVSVVMQDRMLWVRTLGAIALICAIFAGLSLVQALFIDELGWAFRSFRLASWGGHEMADFHNPIISALYFGVAMLVALHLTTITTGVARGVYAFAAAVMLIYLYFTYSRGIWGAGLTGIFMLLWPALNWKKILKWLAVTVISMSLILLWLSLNQALNMSFRDEIFYGWLRQVQGNWLLGSGAGAETNICIKGAGRCFNQAHSLYLQFTFEYGVLGLLLLLAFVGVLVRNGLRLRESDDMARLGLALVAFMLVSSVANYYVIFLRPGVFWMVFWLPVGILMAMPRRGAAE